MSDGIEKLKELADQIEREHEFEYSFNFCPTCGAKVVEP